MIIYTTIPDEEHYKVTAKLYRKENTEFQTQWKKLWLGCALSLIVIAMSVAETILTKHREDQWLAFLALGIIIFVLEIYLMVRTRKQVLKKIIPKGESTQNKELTYTFGEEITIRSGEEERRLSREEIGGWGEAEHYLYLRYGDSYILLDKNKMQEEEMIRLKGWIYAEQIPSAF